jgi:hypothetical protein
MVVSGVEQLLLAFKEEELVLLAFEQAEPRF